jgi:prepilin-type N-terminal cleavage/methylation domain-containing protein/prepilin-type processing-associated H-X9-DG protein
MLMRMVFSAGRRGGFTLTELLVVIAVLGILAALVVGGAQSAIRSGRTAGTLSNMKQLTSALLAYAAENNNMLPDSRYPGGGFHYSWDLQLFPYLGIQNGYSGTELDPKLRQGLDLKLFRCPLDSRQMSPDRAFYPRSYGVTAAAVYMVVPGSAQPFDGGISGRRQGEGIRLAAVPKPGQFVVLCRVPKDWETTNNVVGVQAQSIYNGPDPMNPATWEPYRPLFGGRTPYGFADGHVALLNQQEALLVNPNTWSINK